LLNIRRNRRGFGDPQALTVDVEGQPLRRQRSLRNAATERLGYPLSLAV
jgi:hypothetical protein